MLNQTVVTARPPNFSEILKAFPAAIRPGVIFSWGKLVYVPSGIPLTPALIAHEAVHGERQGDDIEGWWGRYIADPAFRLAEEVPAHAAELRVLIADAPTRQRRRYHIAETARRLAGPLYGRLVSLAEAKRLIVEAGGEEAAG